MNHTKLMLMFKTLLDSSNSLLSSMNADQSQLDVDSSFAHRLKRFETTVLYSEQELKKDEIKMSNKVNEAKP